MQPEIHLGPLTLQTFGIMFALALHRRRGAGRAAAAASSASRPTGPTRWSSRRWSAGSSARGVDFIVENYDAVKRRPARQHLLRLGAGLVRRRDRRRDRRRAVGVVARDAQRSPCSTSAPRRWRSATRSGGSAASSRATATTARPGTGPGRWPTRRHHADDTDRPPDADLRDARDGPGRLPALAPARPLSAPASCSRIYLVLAGRRALPGRVHPPQRRRRSSASPRRSSMSVGR